jgi:hypothetical protein
MNLLHLPVRAVQALAVVVLTLCVVLSLNPPAQAMTLIRTQELPELVKESRRAVLATVTSVHYGFDERQLHSTFIKLRVDDHLYGPDAVLPGEEFEIKLYGAPDRMSDGSRLFVDGTPRYTVGDRFFLLLKGESPWGFTNTAGLQQGAFRISSDGAGILHTESLVGNRSVLGEGGLGRWLDGEDLPRSEAGYLTVNDRPVPYTLFRRAVLNLWAGLGRPVENWEPPDGLVSTQEGESWKGGRR